MPPQCQILPGRRGPALREATAALRERGVLLTFSWLWDPEKAAGPLGLSISSGGWFILVPPLRSTGFSTAGSSDALVLPQIPFPNTGQEMVAKGKSEIL